MDEDESIHFYRHDEVGAEIANAALHRMKFPTSVINSVVKGVANHMRLKQSGAFGEKVSDKALRKLRVDLGDDLDMILDVMHADNLAHHPDHILPNQIPGIRARLQNLGESAPPKVTLPVDGNDVMRELSLSPGPKVRTVLEAVKEEWFANPDLTRDEALTLIRSMAV